MGERLDSLEHGSVEGKVTRGDIGAGEQRRRGRQVQQPGLHTPPHRRHNKELQSRCRTSQGRTCQCQHTQQSQYVSFTDGFVYEYRLAKQRQYVPHPSPPQKLKLTNQILKGDRKKADKIFTLLVENGADVDISYPSGHGLLKTALFGDCAKIILAISNTSARAGSDLKALLKVPPGSTVVHSLIATKASTKGGVAMLKGLLNTLLTERDIDVDELNEEGMYLSLTHFLSLSLWFTLSRSSILRSLFLARSLFPSSLAYSHPVNNRVQRCAFPSIQFLATNQTQESAQKESTCR